MDRHSLNVADTIPDNRITSLTIRIETRVITGNANTDGQYVVCDNSCCAFIGGLSNTHQIKSFLLVYEAVKTTINDHVEWWGNMGRVIWK